MTSDSEDILSTAADWRAAGETVALATVVETWGSSPRPAGSRFAVTASGRIEAYMNGWRRPKRECQWSDSEPASGSVNASTMSAVPTAMPASVPGRPSTWV